MVRDTGTAALIATHNPELAARMDRTYRLHEGRLEGLPLEQFRADRNLFSIHSSART
jgi:ABC-type lipoprotein export system ATPase subunit